MANDVGSLNVKVSATTADLARDMNTNAASVARFASQARIANTTMRETGGGASRLTQGMLELSRGVEDAAAVYGTSGFSGAIRASANNISQFASMVHPAAGAVAGFAVAVGVMLLPKLEKVIPVLREAKQAGFEFAAGLKASQNAIDDLAKAQEFRNRIEDLQGGEQGADFRKDLERQLKLIDDQITATAKLRRETGQAMRQGAEGAGDLFAFVFTGGQAGARSRDFVKFEEQRKKAAEAYKEESERLDKLKRQRELTAKALADLGEQEPALAREDNAKRQMEEEQKRGEMIRKEREEASKLARTLRGELIPEDERRAQIMEELQERQRQIRSLNIDDSQKNMLLGQAEGSARKKLEAEFARLRAEGKDPLGVQRGLAKGSSEALSAAIRASAGAAGKKPEEETARNTKQTVDALAKLRDSIDSLKFDIKVIDQF